MCCLAKIRTLVDVNSWKIWKRQRWGTFPIIHHESTLAVWPQVRFVQSVEETMWVISANETVSGRSLFQGQKNKKESSDLQDKIVYHSFSFLT